jgi:hypothetical protein
MEEADDSPMRGGIEMEIAIEQLVALFEEAFARKSLSS